MVRSLTPFPTPAPLVRAVLALIVVLAVASPAALGATYQVGAGQDYATLAALPALQPGDVVDINPGTYNEVMRWTAGGTAAAPVTIQGVGSPAPLIDATGLTVDGSLPNPRACFQLEASYITVSNLQFANARNGDNGSGIRVTSFGATNVGDLIEGCTVSQCDMGIMTDTCDQVTISGNEIYDNGTALYSGYSHNFYLGGGTNILIGNYIHDALYGQNVKSRAHCTELFYNCIEDSQDGEVGLVDSADTATANSNAVLIGNLIISKDRGAGWNSTRFIQFGEDLGGAHTGTLYAYYNTCIAGTTDIDFLWSDIAGADLVASDNIFVASLNISPGDSGTITGANNWMPTGASVPTGMTGSVFAADPGFVDAGAGDYQLTATSSARAIAATGVTWLDGNGNSQSGTPVQQYAGLGDLVARSSGVDDGAYGDPTAAGTTSSGTTATGTTSSGTTATGTTSSGTTATGTTATGTTATSSSSSTSVGGFATAGGSGAASGGGSGGCGVGGAGTGLLLLAGLRRRLRWCARA